MQIRSKVWIEKSGELIFGEGKSRIFKLIQEHQSINKAAEKMGWSFRHAWSYIGEIEKRANVKLVERVKGGAGGGGSRLTSYAVELMERYDGLKDEIDRYTDVKFKEAFKEWNK